MNESAPRVARRATGFLFFFLGCVVATWATRIPDVQLNLDLSPGVLGGMLLLMGAGAVAAMLVTGRIIHAFGSGRVVRWAAFATGTTLMLPLFAPTLWILALALFAFGLAQGMMDVSMNAQGVAVERGYGRPVMSSLHALFSIGGLAGSGYASLLLYFGASIALHLALVLIPLAAGWLVARRHLLPDPGDEEDTAPLFALPRGILVWLGAIAVLSMVGEGAVLDWSALYMRQALGTNAAVAAAAFAAFSLTMTGARLCGDAIVARYGDVVVLRYGGLVAGLGMGMALIIGSPAVSLLGFACVGAGLANVVPLAFSRAGRIPGLGAGYGIAAVSTVGYGGFFIGPPAIGFVSDRFGLVVGLGLIPLLAFGISLVSRRLSSGESRTTEPGTPRQAAGHCDR